MADDLTTTMLQRATGIEPAPPDRGWFSADTPHPILDQGKDLMRGLLTKSGGFDPINSGAEGVGAILGAMLPMVKGGPFAGMLRKISPAALVYTEDSPQAQAIIDMLNEYKGLSGEEAAAEGALRSRVTSRKGYPQGSIKSPEGFIFKRQTSASSPNYWSVTSPNTERHDAWQNMVNRVKAVKEDTHPVISSRGVGDLRDIEVPSAVKNQSPPAKILNYRGITGAQSKSAQASLAKAHLTEDIVRDIRQMNDMAAAAKKYPNVKPNTIQGIVKEGTFGWIKVKP